MSETTAPLPPAPAGPPPAPAAAGAVPGPPSFRRWTPGRVASIVTGAVAGTVALMLVAGGSLALTADRVVRDDAGFLGTGPVTVTGSGYAVTSEPIRLDLGPGDEPAVRDLLGDVRLQATGTDPGVPVFLGIAPTVEVDRYLAGVARDRLDGITDGTADAVAVPGSVVPAEPATQTFWTERATGTGTQTLTWRPRSGDWTVVVMRADAGRSPSVELAAAAQAPVVTWLAGLTLAAGLGLLAVSTVLVLVPVVRAVRTPRS